MPRPRHLLLNAWLNSSGAANDSWLSPGRDPARIFDLSYYVANAAVAREGIFANVFLSDRPQLVIDDRTRPEHTVDPMVLLPAVLSHVPDIGAVVTATTTYNSPYTLARQLQTANVLTRGRIRWNVVTTWHPAVAANYGIADLPDREARYRRAEEFIDIVVRLWDSWRFPWSDAPRPAGPRGSGHAYGVVEPISYHSDAFSVAGPLNVPAYEGQRPLIVQAGGSERGIALAGRWADLVYAQGSSKQATAAFRARLNEAARRAGRTDGGPLLLPAISPTIVSTEAEAEALRRERLESATDTAREREATLAARLGIDLERFDPRTPLRRSDIAIPQDSIYPIGAITALAERAIEGSLTLQQLAREQSSDDFIGTPEQFAATLAEWWDDEVADGFTISSPRLPDDLRLFVDTVVPLLQASGRYPRDYAETTPVRPNSPIPAR